VRAESSTRSQRGLDWFAFFLVDVQTGWGPFVAAYLTSVAWPQFDVGRILTIGTPVGLVLQIPAEALVDRVLAKRGLAALAVVAVSGSALLLVLWPVFDVVVVAKVLHAVGSCLAGPAVAAISLGLLGRHAPGRAPWSHRALSLARQRCRSEGNISPLRQRAPGGWPSAPDVICHSQTPPWSRCHSVAVRLSTRICARQ